MKILNFVKDILQNKKKITKNFSISETLVFHKRPNSEVCCEPSFTFTNSVWINLDNKKWR